MTQQAVKTAITVSTLQVQKGATEYNQQLQALTNTAWQIAYTALWNTMEFSTQEKQVAKEFIENFIHQSTNHKKAYNELVQRVLLARQYVNTHPGTYIPFPSIWFNTQNKNGYIGTQKWFNTVQINRASLPNYKQSLKAFAQAIEETTQSNNPTDFHYWRTYFVEQNSQSLLNLFLSTLANINFSSTK
jgi:hypothetical protein